MQGLRLATSSEVEYNSSCDVREVGEGIKMHQISNYQGDPINEIANICTNQENKPGKPEASPFQYLNLNSPIHLSSSCFSKQLQLPNLSPPEYDPNHIQNSKFYVTGSNSLDRTTYRSSVVNVEQSQPLSTRFKVGLIDGPTNCYTRTCQEDPVCNAKFSRLTSELEDAKKQVQYLEDILKMKDIEDEEDGSSTDADFIDLEQGTLLV